MSLISVIVPVYNREEFLKPCVASLCNQTLSDIEIILVDDGSTDQTGEVCDTLAETDKRIKVIHKKNGGAADARNQGIQNATGLYIMFLDSDDCFLPDYCEKMYAAQEKYGEHALCMSGVQFVDYKENRILATHFGKEDQDEQILKGNEILELYKIGLLNVAWNKIYSRETIVQEHIVQHITMVMGEDTIFVYDYIEAMRINRFVVINTVSYRANVHEKFSLSKSFYEDYFQTFLYVYYRLKQLCLIYQVPKKEDELLTDMYWGIVEGALKNTMKKGNKASILKKVRTNSKILLSSEVQEHLVLEGERLGVWKRRIYKSGNYGVVLIYNFIRKIFTKNRRVKTK